MHHAWSPHSASLINKTESVQRRLTKGLTGCGDLNYGDRLTKIGIDSLEMRRLHVDLIHAYKIIFGVIDTDADSFFVQCTNETTRGQNVFNFIRQ